MHIKSIIFSAIVSLLLGVASQSFAQSNQKNFGSDFNGDNLRPIRISDIVASKFLKDSTHIYSRTELDSNWVLSAKRIYQYGNLGEERVIEEFDKQDANWVRKLRVENSFNGELNIVVQREMSWNPISQDWVLEFERALNYNYLDLVSDEVLYRKNGTNWIRDLRREYIYTDSQNIDTETNFVWDAESGSWLPDTRKVYDYFDTDLISSETLQTWNDSLGKWQNQVSRAFEYDDNNNLISSIRSTWNDIDKLWVSISMMSLHYNEKGQLESSQQSQLGASVQLSLLAQDANYDDDGNLGEIIHSNWNSEAEAWEIFKKEKHFWSEKRTGTDIGYSSDINCTFTNPYIKGFPWYCESLKESVNYTLDLYDISGRHFHSQQFTGGSTFRIRGDIPSGIYVAIIRGGLDVHSEKVIIRE